MAALGVTTPLSEGTFCVTDAPLRLIATDRAVEAGDLVSLSGGALYAGYAGVVGRTRVCPGTTPPDAVERLRARWADVWASLTGVLRPGATGADVVAAYRSTGEPLPPFPVVHGVGLGLEPPVIGADGHDGVLDDGMTLAVGGYVSADGVGGMLVRETVRITTEGPDVLTRLSDR
jgi:Xaa-Pro aminopeptidase